MLYTSVGRSGQSASAIAVGWLDGFWVCVNANEGERFARERNPTLPPLTDLYSTVVDD